MANLRTITKMKRELEKRKELAEKEDKKTTKLEEEIIAREHNLRRVAEVPRVQPSRAMTLAVQDCGDSIMAIAKRKRRNYESVMQRRNDWSHKTRFITVQTMAELLNLEIVVMSRDGEIFPLEKMRIKQRPDYDPNYAKRKDAEKESDPRNFF